MKEMHLINLIKNTVVSLINLLVCYWVKVHYIGEREMEMQRDDAKESTLNTLRAKTVQEKKHSYTTIVK